MEGISEFVILGRMQALLRALVEENNFLCWAVSLHFQSVPDKFSFNNCQKCIFICAGIPKNLAHIFSILLVKIQLHLRQNLSFGGFPLAIQWKPDIRQLQSEKSNVPD